MKKIGFFSCLVLISLSAYSFILYKKTTVYSINKIEKNWGKVKNNLFASKFETTNKEYQLFLRSIQSTSTPEKFESLRVQVENWNPPGKNTMKPLVDNYYQHPSYENYPLVNVSHAGAVAYCQWLSNVYNNRPKRKYKKVKFRLPTEAEWIAAARGGHQEAPFPWGGYYTRNGNGEFLANFMRIPDTSIKRNFKTGEIEIKDDVINNFKADLNDAYAFPAPVLEYHANNFGLHNMSGNVAEMLAEAGQTKGGSWASTGYYIRIDAEDEYAGITKPDPRIGFRYFVEIIEE